MAAKRILIFLFCTVALFSLQTTVFAQPGDGPPTDDVPITGIEYLIGGGIAYGIRSLIKGRKKKGD